MNSGSGTGASKSLPRIVPWLDTEEWHSVRKSLYSVKIEEIQLGILKAKIWMGRGKVPTAIESTVNFLEIILSDTEYLDEFLNLRNLEFDSDSDLDDFSDNELGIDRIDKKEFENADERLLRLAYNTAVIRFVNELVDRAQKSLFATSITKLADQIGLPRVFVDIRHDGTHDRLSSLELLRWASVEALKWLEDQYWSFEDDYTPVAWLNEFNVNVFGVLDQFCEQIEKINETQSAAALEKSSQARIINQIGFLQTLPRIMKAFLVALSEFKRKNFENVLESIVRLLARNNGEMFYSVIVEVIFYCKNCDNWTDWIVDELKKSKNNELITKFSTTLLTEFAKKSESVLFNEKLEKIWNSLRPLLVSENENKFVKIFEVFSRVYGDKSCERIVKQQVSKKNLFESREFVNQHRFKEDLNLEGWAFVCENWRPCPLGSIPN